MKRLLFKALKATVILSLVLLWGCSSTPSSIPESAVEPSGQERELTEIEQLLLQAETAPPIARAQYTLEAALRLLEQQLPQAALQQLNQTNLMLLTDQQQPLYWLLQTEAALQLQLPQQAQNWLNQILNPELLNNDQFQRYQQLRSQLFLQQGDQLAALKALIAESQTSALDRQAELAEQIWSALQNLDKEQLREQLAQQNSYHEQGWFELALLARNHDRDIIQINEALDSWFQLWGMHPAAGQLPYQLQQLRQFGSSMPSHIAVLLPQSGSLERHGNAIIEGLMAVHLQQHQFGDPTPRISFFDSSQYGDLDEFYTEARQQEVELVIGPLDKSRLSQLTERASVPIPTLALNAVDSATTTLNLFQFGLRNRDEAIQSADQAWNDGHRIALTLTPATGWGKRVEQSFNRRWTTLGGIVANSEQFSDSKDLSAKISRLVGTDQSEQRARDLAQTINQKIEFEPRRRQDIEMLYLTALNKDARQIKPTLAFHYAGDLPVYASSHLFDGKPDQSRYQDLSGVQFSGMPWVLEEDNPLRANLTEFRDDTRSRFGRLYALGIDSYRLAPYLAQLHTLPDAYIQGQSGKLSIDLFGQVSRVQSWMKIRPSGQFNPLPVSATPSRE